MQNFLNTFFEVFPYFNEAPIAYILIIVLLIVSIIGFYWKPLYYCFLLYPYELSKGNKIYTVLTSNFIHKNWKHLLFNSIVIFVFVYDFHGILIQEFTVYARCLLFAVLFTYVTIPNLILTYKKRKDPFYTSAGASGISFGLLGSNGLYFPLEKMSESFFIPFNYAYQYWTGLLVILIIMSFRKRTKSNHLLHLYAFILGSIWAIMLNPNLIIKLKNHLYNL